MTTTSDTSTAMTVERLNEFGAAWNAHDIERIVAFFTPDGAYLGSVGPDDDGTAFRGIDEVRRELKKRHLSGSGAVCVSLFGGLDVQVADLGQEFEAALRELLDHVKADLTPRQKRIVDLRMEKQEESELALKLKVSESTIDKEIVSIKKKIVLSMAKISDQRPTTNDVATRLEEIV